MQKIAFNTANLVGRATNYRFDLSNWMAHDRQTTEVTNAAEFDAICHDIAAAGYTAIELWSAHASARVMSQAMAMEWSSIMASNGLKPIAYAGPLTHDTARLCAWLQIPLIAGGGHPRHEDGSPDLETMRSLCREFGVRYGFENHPEKTAAAILAHIGGGDDLLGVAVDTGWLATQGTSVPGVIRELGTRIFHVHVKDIAAVGGHETVPLGQGIAELEACFAILKDLNFTGWYSWEDEPEARNPFDIAAQMRLWIESKLSSS